MSLNKFGEKSFADKKADAHESGWQDEMKESKNASSRELGIYDRQKVEDNLHRLYTKTIVLPEFKFLKEIKENFPGAGVYLVGGSVRDAIVGKIGKDNDLVINGIDPLDLVELLMRHGRITFDRNPKADLSKMSDKEKEKLIKNCYGIIKFKPEGSELKELIDIAFPREDDYSKAGKSGIRGIKRDTETVANPNLSINRDLERRDLTINAMAINLVNGDIVDPFDGIEDLIKGQVRAVGDPRERILYEDFSRAFRVIRFACVFNADIEKATKKAMREVFRKSERTAEEVYRHEPDKLREVKRYENEIRRIYNIAVNDFLPRFLQVFFDREQNKPRLAVAREVMSKEIIKAINANPKRFIELLDEVGGLGIIFPELERLKNLGQPREHHREGDVFSHTILVLSNLPKNASLRLKLAALFHDIGKFGTQGKKDDGKITFYGHDENSVTFFAQIAKRLRLDTELRKGVEFLISNHMTPLSETNVANMKSSKIARMFLTDEKLGSELIALATADAHGSIPETGEKNLKSINILLARISEIKARIGSYQKEKAKPLVSGKDIMSALNMKSGPEVGKILAQIEEARLAGEVVTKEDALTLAKKLT
jgi:tRNA nucleotidyltransferase/poly(A) polymerase